MRRTDENDSTREMTEADVQSERIYGTKARKKPGTARVFQFMEGRKNGPRSLQIYHIKNHFIFIRQ